MKRSLVMTIIGADRPGLVDAVAAVVAAHSGNWLESRMSRLGGQFAGILHAEVPKDQEKSLLQDLKGLDAGGLQVVIHTETPATTAVRRPLSVLEIIGQDRPGIIREVSRALASYGVN